MEREAAARDMPGAHWVVQTRSPAAWPQYVEACGGGFFHSSLGLGYGAPEGEPVFALLEGPGAVVGCALGVRSPCALTRRPAHYYFPTLPVLVSTTSRDEALANLVAGLRSQGAAEARFDSFDARWRPGDGLPAGGTRTRIEHIVPLLDDPERQLRGFHESHRRKARRGAREGWTLELPVGQEAVDLLQSIDESGAERGRPIVGLQDLRLSAEQDSGTSGAAVFAACADGAPLSGALVGWSHGRAVYLIGGSTPEGYRRAAAVWLHWRIMEILVGRGLKEYSLGGTGEAASRPESPRHGLYRFKAGFGGEVVACHGAGWALRPNHMRAHAVWRRLAALVGR
jgi:Acetyltransferase (GNAT) domain